jgi:hypothetical protein
MTDFQLTDGERAHPLWQRLKAHWTNQLALARARNDNAALTEAQTAELRGRIAAHKSNLGLGEPRPVIPE